MEYLKGFFLLYINPSANEKLLWIEKKKKGCSRMKTISIYAASYWMTGMSESIFIHFDFCQIKLTTQANSHAHTQKFSA